MELFTPKELGGPGGAGTNPEKLFATGYSACFLGALKVAGRELKLTVSPETTATARIGIGARAEGGFGIAASLSVHLPGLEKSDAERLVNTAHGICPYSDATRNNVDVELAVV